MELSDAARLIGDPARAAMLDALLSGDALAAGELARVARVSAATASEHLSRLRDGGLVEVTAAGRHRYYRLASPDVGYALEALSLLGSSRDAVTSLRASRADEAMRLARTCYDHLAGRLGVAVHDALVGRGALSAGGDGYRLTPSGQELFAGLGVAVGPARAARRRYAGPCLDFTERRPHLAGALAAALCTRFVELGWLTRRVPGQRALRITGTGRTAFAEVLKLDL